jgi:cyclopropane-fatty-acyl-phospholipid synthase
VERINIVVNIQVKTHNSDVARTLDILQSVLAGYPSRNFAIRLWDGTIWQQEAGQPRQFTIVLNHSAALRRMFFPPTERRLGEAYIFGDFDIEGDLLEAFNVGRYLLEQWHWLDTLRYAPQLLRLPMNGSSSNSYQAHLSGSQHSLARDQQAIQYHYDVSNDFYQLWLDKQMVYSCAYFTSPDDDIDKAQTNKLDYICRKLRLQPGERLLDIGCGWGAMIIHAAKHYGVNALGVTLSQKQYDYARKRIADEGLESQCQVELIDYRTVDESQPFDKIVSVGMVEHVGRDQLSTYFEKAYRLLRPGGVFLNHGITVVESHDPFFMRARDSFLQQYIFPDGDLQSIGFILEAASRARFEIRDVEDLREHYALTLKCWYERLEAHKQTVLNMMDKMGYRLWRIYLMWARWSFEYGNNGVHQTLLYKMNDGGRTGHDLPLTRTDWYLTE